MKIKICFCVVAAGFFLFGCPKQIPKQEIDAAESAMSALEKNKDCAPETYQAAKTMMNRAAALMKEERYEEAKTAYMAAQKLALKAEEECQKKRQADEEARKKAEADALAASKEMPVAPAVEDKAPAGLSTVYFRFNESDLVEETRAILSKNADYLNANPAMRIQIEGHCDSRGSTEYNLALGERRAIAVRQYLAKLGVNPDRMDIISYGEERPVDSENTEEAYTKNRRAEFKPFKQ
jgi:peptidoglycan-associated lipoprotein